MNHGIEVEMRGRMMEMPLLVSSLIEHAGRVHAERTVTSRTVEGPVHHSSWGEILDRSKKLANALAAVGIQEGDRVGTIAWNTHRHLEAYYAISGMGAICHTLNPRLHPSELVYIVNHAEDRVLFVDLTFVPLLEAVAEQLGSVEHFVVMTDAQHMPETSLSNAVCYEDFVAAQSSDHVWPALDEGAACALCYTSGTTGSPKGVLFSHRSTVLHAFAVAMPEVFQLSPSQTILPIVPLFHACGWGIPYAAAATGAAIVFPGPNYDALSLTQLMTSEQVTACAGVPSVFVPLTQHWREHGGKPASLRLVAMGGAAPPRSMIEALEGEFGVEFRHAWGMTETSPLGSVTTLTPSQREGTIEERSLLLTKQGRPPFGVEIRIVDHDGMALPHDGVASGELQVRGPWVITSYFKADESALTPDGWFPTGDVATVDAGFLIRITDRTKDLIKSGGEWISSIDVENTATGHPEIMEAAVIGVPDEKWGERPLLIAVPVPGGSPTSESVLAHLSKTLAKWQLPDEVIFVAALPMGATGKVQKAKLREEYSAR